MSGREPGPGRAPHGRGDGRPPLSRTLAGWFRVRAEQNLAESVATESLHPRSHVFIAHVGVGAEENLRS